MMYQRTIIILTKLSLLLFLIVWGTACQPSSPGPGTPVPTPDPSIAKLGVNFWDDVMVEDGHPKQLFKKYKAGYVLFMETNQSNVSNDASIAKVFQAGLIPVIRYDYMDDTGIRYAVPIDEQGLQQWKEAFKADIKRMLNIRDDNVKGDKPALLFIVGNEPWVEP